MDTDFVVIRQLVRRRRPLIRFLCIGPYLCSTFLQIPPRGDTFALRYPSPPSGWDGTCTRKLSNLHGVQKNGRPWGGRPHESSIVRCLHFRWCRLTGNTLPLTGRHLHPRVGPALTILERLSHRIGAFTFEAPGRDGRIAKYRYLHIVVRGAVPFSVFVKRKRPSLVVDFPIGLRNHDLVSQQRRD
jgi:hypothetical protein